MNKNPFIDTHDIFSLLEEEKRYTASRAIIKIRSAGYAKELIEYIEWLQLHYPTPEFIIIGKSELYAVKVPAPSFPEMYFNSELNESIKDSYAKLRNIILTAKT